MRDLSSAIRPSLTHELQTVNHQAQQEDHVNRPQWIAVTAASALGIGAIAAGAMTVANAVEIRDAEGQLIEAAQIRGDIVDSGAISVKITGDHASVVAPTPSSAATAATAASPAPAPSAPAAPAAPAVQPPAPQPAPPAVVDVPSANTVGSAYSAVSVESAGSPD